MNILNKSSILKTSRLIFALIFICGLFILFGCRKKNKYTTYDIERSEAPSDVKLLVESEIGDESKIRKHIINGETFYRAINIKGNTLFCKEENTKYIKVSRGAPNSILYLNEILTHDEFNIDGFQDKEKYLGLITSIRFIHSDVTEVVMDENLLGWAKRGVESWLKGREKNEDVLYGLFYDPIVNVDGYQWSIKFNCITIKGAVRQWYIQGVNEPNSQINQIKNIEIETIKKNGTFSLEISV